MKNEDGRRYMAKAIPAGLVSPQVRGWSRTMKESAELGARVTTTFMWSTPSPGLHKA